MGAIIQKPDFTFCSTNLAVEAVGNERILNMDFNGNDAVCNTRNVKLTPKRPRSGQFREYGVRFCSTELVDCDGNQLRVLYLKSPRGSGVEYRKKIVLRNRGPLGPACIYGKVRRDIHGKKQRPSTSPSPGPSALPSPKEHKKKAGVSPSPVPSVTTKRRVPGLGRGICIGAAVLAGISLAITVGCCWASRQQLYTPLCGVSASWRKAIFGAGVTILCTGAAIVAEYYF